ncbi:MAG: RsmB/NOP family class I SAM-dependent RNA methyltransferase, partial [Candidatus Omnitrophica bacterium]|nr:RsmB/NOP family class I SAM-dependent RNA methyltransferase [Candidatus Omnitrophota bacterium]
VLESASFKKDISGENPLEKMIKDGFLFIQNPSSALVPLILNPKPGENILDMCSAPGSKTSYIAQLMQNKGRIVSVESVRSRMYKLLSVIKLLGVEIADIVLTDGRRYKPKDMFFDRVLVDAPCSSEGRFTLAEEKSYCYWSMRKIKEMQHKQKGLLLNAGRALKPGGVLVYSTCTFSPEENEGVVDWFLKKTSPMFQLEEIAFPQIERYPAIISWLGKHYNPEVKKCLRVLPDEIMDGFFIACFIKNG